MKISPYTSYLESQPNALLVRQNFYYLQKVGVTFSKKTGWAQSQVEPLATPCGLAHRILEGERRPCLFLVMPSHRLLLAWGVILSSEGVTPFSRCSEPLLPSPGTLSLVSQGTRP
jgi:hypothetical protein